jgi:release factor glutamine methyltransferase
MPPLPDSLTSRLRAAGCVFAEDEAALLTEAAAGPDELEALLARRIAGEPLETLLGWAWFCQMRIVVAPGVFVPRRRTELLVAQAVEVAVPGAVVVELCAGVGAVAAAIAAARPDVRLSAADLDPVAVQCARRNLHGRGMVYCGDLFAALPDALRGRVDVLVANATYVPSEAIAMMPPEARDYEPRRALDGGTDGLDVHRRITAAVPEWLRPGRGQLLIETSRAQAPGSAALAEAAGLQARVVRDDELDATAVLGAF